MIIAMAKTRGRPKLARTKYRGRRLNIRLTEAEYRKFTRVAEQEGTTLSELVRRLLEERAADG